MFIGRKDNQLKIRGYRVEIGDIEKIILEIPDVKTVKVIIDNNNNDLIAYVVLNKQFKNINSLDLRYLCQQKLPYYMIPRAFQFLEKLPLTANSKIDVTKLPLPNYSNNILIKNTNKNKNDYFDKDKNLYEDKSYKNYKEIDSDQKNNNKLNNSIRKNNDNTLNSLSLFLSQNNNLRKKILKIFSETLDIINIKMFLNNNFIYLGGNSLNGQRIINKINSKFLLDNSLLDLSLFLDTNLMLFDIIVSIIKIILKETDYNTKTKKENVSFNLKKIPLSFQQEQMYYLSQIDYKKLYTLPLIQKFSLEVNLSLLHFAFIKTIQDHAILRTIIYETKKYDLCQQVLSMTESYHKCEKHNFELFTKKNVLNFFKETFDLMTEPPIKCQIFKAENHYVLILLMHHIASDASSTNILEQNIMKNYNYISNNYANTLVLPRNLYANNYLFWSYKQKTPKSILEINEKCNQLTLKLIPFIKNCIIIDDYFKNESEKLKNWNKKFISKQFSISHNILKQYSFTTFIYIIAAFIKTLVNFLKNSFNFNNENFKNLCILIGSPASNRLIKNNEEVIGNYLNNLILAFSLDNFINSDVITEDELQIIKNTVEEAQKYESIPYGNIINAIRHKFPKLFLSGKLFNIYINCRYELENELYLTAMKDVIIDKTFTEETLELIKNDNNELNHFIELDVDKLSKTYDIKLKISTINNTIIYNTNFIYEFLNLFEKQCKQIFANDLKNVSYIVYQAICETLNSKLEFKNNETFFSIGGNSLLLIKLRRLLEIKLAISIDLLDLINNLEIDKIIQLCIAKINIKNENNQLIKNQNKSLSIHKPFYTISDKSKKEIKKNNITNSQLIQRLYVSPNFFQKENNAKIIFVMFHALLGGNLTYMTLKDSIKTFNTNNLMIIGIQHPETFYKTTNYFPQNSLLELAKYYSKNLENYLIENNLIKNIKFIFIGASMGATIAYEVSVFFKVKNIINLVSVFLIIKVFN